MKVENRMTEKKAIEILKEEKEYFGAVAVLDAFNMAIRTLEKQIPKKPFLEGDGYADGKMVYDTWRCPNCDSAYETEFDDYDYCPKCGQKILWEAGEE